MDEREILRIAAHHDIDEYFTEVLTLEFVRDVLKADRRTTSDRDAIIEECAQAALNARLDLIWKGERLTEAKEVGYVCAAAIRALKTTPTAASREEGNG